MTKYDFAQYRMLIKAYADNKLEPTHGLAYALVGMFDFINEKYSPETYKKEFHETVERHVILQRKIDENLIICNEQKEKIDEIFEFLHKVDRAIYYLREQNEDRKREMTKLTEAKTKIHPKAKPKAKVKPKVQSKPKAKKPVKAKAKVKDKAKKVLKGKRK